MVHILRLGRHQLVDPMELAARASLFALFDMREVCVEALLTLVVIVLNVVLPAVQQIQTAGDEDGNNSYGAVRRIAGVNLGTGNNVYCRQQQRWEMEWFSAHLTSKRR